MILQRIKNLFHEHDYQFLGHTESQPKDQNYIRLHYLCKSCNHYYYKDYHPNHQIVNKDYQWWMHQPLTQNQLNSMIQLPKYILFQNITFITLPFPYQEYFVRLYYHNTTNETKIPDTIPIENIEDYLTNNLTPEDILSAQGYAQYYYTKEGDNTKFTNIPEFTKVIHYIAKLYYINGLKNNHFHIPLTEKQFLEYCIPLTEIGL